MEDRLPPRPKSARLRPEWWQDELVRRIRLPVSRLRLSKLLRPCCYRALQGPKYYPTTGVFRLHIVTPGFVRAAHEVGIRVDVWTIDQEPDMRRLLASGMDGIMTDRPDVLARVLGEDAARSRNTVVIATVPLDII